MRTNAKNSQDISAKTGERTQEPLLQSFYPDTQDDQGHDKPEGVVYLLTATKIPAGHRKMVRTKIWKTRLYTSLVHPDLQP